jgi:hypothetical protein
MDLHLGAKKILLKIKTDTKRRDVKRVKRQAKRLTKRLAAAKPVTA